MKRKAAFFALAIILFGLNVCVWLFVSNRTNKSTPVPSEQSPSDSILKRDIIVSYENTGLALGNPVVYLGSDTAKSFKFFSRFTDKCLVFRFSGNYCDECIDLIIADLKKYLPDYDKNDRIILLGSELSARVKDGYYGKKVLSYTSTTGLGLPLEKSFIPFLFIVDKGKVSEMVFMPMRSQPDLTKEYLQYINYKYFKPN